MSRKCDICKHEINHDEISYWCSECEIYFCDRCGFLKLDNYFDDPTLTNSKKCIKCGGFLIKSWPLDLSKSNHVPYNSFSLQELEYQDKLRVDYYNNIRKWENDVKRQYR